MMSKKSFFMLTVFFIFIVGSAICALSQSKESCKTISIKMDKQPLAKVFKELLYVYEIQIGFEESKLDVSHDDYFFETNLPDYLRKREYSFDNGNRVSVRSERIYYAESHTITIDVKDAYLEDVLDIIVPQMNFYQWEINDGVVNIFPKEGRDARFEELLNVNIQEYNFQEGFPIEFLRQNIYALPEIVKFMDKNKLYPSTEREALSNVGRKLPEGFSFSNLKFKDLLNKISKIKGGGWILKPSKRKKEENREFIYLDI